MRLDVMLHGRRVPTQIYIYVPPAYTTFSRDSQGVKMRGTVRRSHDFTVLGETSNRRWRVLIRACGDVLLSRMPTWHLSREAS